jgi:hypothetical protein
LKEKTKSFDTEGTESAENREKKREEKENSRGTFRAGEC